MTFSEFVEAASGVVLASYQKRWLDNMYNLYEKGQLEYTPSRGSTKGTIEMIVLLSDFYKYRREQMS